METREFQEYLEQASAYIDKIYLIDFSDSSSELKEKIEDGEVYLEDIDIEDLEYYEFTSLCIDKDINFIAELHVHQKYNVKLDENNEIKSCSIGGTKIIEWVYGTELKDIYLKIKDIIEKRDEKIIALTLKDRE